MPMLKLLRQQSLRFVKQARALYQAAAQSVKLWRQQPGLDALEAERLDRIRNPSKYLGKW